MQSLGLTGGWDQAPSVGTGIGGQWAEAPETGGESVAENTRVI